MLPSPLADTPNKGDPGCLSRQELEENLHHKRAICHRLQRQLADLNGRCCSLEQENHELSGGLRLARQMESHYTSELDELERSRKALTAELKQANAAAAAAAAAAASASSMKSPQSPPSPKSAISTVSTASSKLDDAAAGSGLSSAASNAATAASASSEAALAALRSQLAELKAELRAARDAEEESIRERYELELAHKSEIRELAMRLSEAEEAARLESAQLRDRLAERDAEVEALVLAVDEQRLRAAAAVGPAGGAAAASAAAGTLADEASEANAACQLAARGNSLFAELEDRRVKAELRVVELQRAVGQLRDRLARKDSEAAEMRCLFAARMRERTKPAHSAQYVADLEQEAAWSRQQIEALQRKVQLLEVSQDANKLQSAGVLRTFERTCALGRFPGGSGSGGAAAAAVTASLASSHGHVTLEARLAESQEALRSRELECCSLRNTKLEYSRQAAQLRAQLEASEQRVAELELQLIRQKHSEAEFTAALDASCLASVENEIEPRQPQQQQQQQQSQSSSAAATDAAKQKLQSEINYPPQMLQLMQKKYNRNA